MTGSKRQTKTPRQRAEEAVGVMERQWDRLVANKKALDDESDRLHLEIKRLEKRLEHARSHPDLRDPAS